LNENGDVININFQGALAEVMARSQAKGKIQTFGNLKEGQYLMKEEKVALNPAASAGGHKRSVSDGSNLFTERTTAIKQVLAPFIENQRHLLK
jgi:hypothetical protein